MSPALSAHIIFPHPFTVTRLAAITGIGWKLKLGPSGSQSQCRRVRVQPEYGWERSNACSEAASMDLKHLPKAISEYLLHCRRSPWFFQHNSYLRLLIFVKCPIYKKGFSVQRNNLLSKATDSGGFCMQTALGMWRIAHGSQHQSDGAECEPDGTCIACQCQELNQHSIGVLSTNKKNMYAEPSMQIGGKVALQRHVLYTFHFTNLQLFAVL